MYWTRSITRSGSARNASPTFCTQSGFSAIIASTGGNATSDFTAGSHDLSATAGSDPVSESEVGRPEPPSSLPGSGEGQSYNFV